MSIVNERSPQTASGVAPPPDRAHQEVFPATIEIPALESLLPNQAENGQPLASAQEMAFHVLLYLRTDAPTVGMTSRLSALTRDQLHCFNELYMYLGTEEYSEYVKIFLETSATLFLRVLGSPDQQNGHTESYSWPERGWDLAQNFSAHTQASMLRYGQCVFARKLTYSEAYVVHKRLEGSGFRSALVLLGHTAELPVPPPSDRTGHVMVRSPNSTSPPWRWSCDKCKMEIRDPELYSCRPCDADFCQLCACIESGVPCRVLSGVGAGASMPFPPQDAGDEALQASASDMSNLLRQLLQGVSHNSKPATKQSVIDSLPSKRFGAEEMYQGIDASCAICLNEFKAGDNVTQLSCKHCFHIGDHKENGDGDTYCEGIVPWLQKSNDCPM